MKTDTGSSAKVVVQHRGHQPKAAAHKTEKTPATK